MSDSTIDGLKQRLVGAFVILSLAIIFLPMIFDKPHSVGSSSIVPVPPSPDVKTVVLKKPERPVYQDMQVDPADNKVKTIDKIVPARQDNQVENRAGGVVSSETEKPDNRAESKAEPNNAVGAEKDEAVVSSDSARSDQSKATSVASDQAAESETPRVHNLPIFKNVWMVQLGTFSNHQNAYKLRDKLRKDGFDGHTKDIVIDGKKAVRVFTGPFVNKQLAAKTKKKVDKKYKVKSLILYFDA